MNTPTANRDKTPQEMAATAATLIQDEALAITAADHDSDGLHIGYYLLGSIEGHNRALLVDWSEEMRTHQAIPGVTFGDLLAMIDPTQEGPGSEIAEMLYDPAGIQAKYVIAEDPDRHEACHMAAGKIRGKGIGVKAGYFDGADLPGPTAVPAVVALGDPKAVRWMMGAGMPDEMTGFNPTALASTLWREARRLLDGGLRLQALVFTPAGPVVIGPTLRDAACLWGENPNLAVKAIR